ncbi:MAG: pyruvate dehydrogenase (acetyl-transferring) E1 component subunit alpha [Candidatus Promineifilaceae bacterium]|nr:pyruvate dehydrogenase (acetyl-transferring) E1 component subunit alpha [Candidatus Promineifilaceae bacterium]
MPREVIELEQQIEHLSILDENGQLDDDLEPDIDEATLLAMHRTMLLARRFDERMLSLQRQGRIGTFAPVKGQEAAQVGTAAHLDQDDWMIPSFRETAVALWRGDATKSMVNLLLVNGGFFQGGRMPPEQRDLPIAVPVGSQTVHAVGIGYGMKYRDTNQVAMVYFGDGATSEGDSHEALNFAGVFQTPVVFVCQNNQYAISVPRERQSHAKTLAQKALAYGLPGLQVDGNDILAVYAAAQEAVARAREGGGPTLLECVTYRLSLHTTADDPTRYRDEEEVEKWEQRDPLDRFQSYLKEKELLDEDDLDALEEELADQIQEAVDEAESQMDALGDETLSMFEHIYAEMPPYLQQQRDYLAAELDQREKEGANA